MMWTSTAPADGTCAPRRPVVRLVKIGARHCSGQDRRCTRRSTCVAAGARKAPTAGAVIGDAAIRTKADDADLLPDTIAFWTMSGPPLSPLAGAPLVKRLVAGAQIMLSVIPL